MKAVYLAGGSLAIFVGVAWLVVSREPWWAGIAWIAGGAAAMLTWQLVKKD
jgi:hypothetical protein